MSTITKINIRRLLVLLAFFCWVSLARAGGRIPIELAQREAQGRFFVCTSNYLRWPDCLCGSPAPHYPPDNFYGAKLEPTVAVGLVQDLVNQFYAGIYVPFVNPACVPNGAGGRAAFDKFDSSADFPFTAGGADLVHITTNNYSACLQLIRSYIEELNLLGGPFSPPQGVTTNAMGAHFMEFRNAGWGTNSSWTNTLGTLDSLWSAGGWTIYNNDTIFGADIDYYHTRLGVQVFSQYCTAAESGGPSPYWYGQFIVWRGRIACNFGNAPGLTSGTAYNYLMSQTSDYPGGDDGNTPPVAVDDHYHLWSPGTLNVTDPFADYFTPLIGDVDPPSLSTQGDCYTGFYGGWQIDGIATLLAPAFPTAPDKIDCGGCATCGNEPGSVCAMTGSLNLKISLGPDLYGGSAGYFFYSTDLPPLDAPFFDPRHFVLVIGTGYFFSENMDGTLAAINTPLFRIVPSGSPGNCSLDFWDDVTTYPTSIHLGTVTMANVGGDTNKIVVTQAMNGGNKVLQFNYSGGTWNLVQAGGVRTESRSIAWTTPTNEVDTIVVQNTNNVTAAQTTEYYQWLPITGKTLVQQTLGTGSTARTTTWSYDLVTGLLTNLVEPSGRWEYYQYDPNGRLTNQVSQFGDNAITTGPSANRVTETAYDDTNSFVRTVEFLLGTEIARHYSVDFIDTVNSFEQHQDIRCTVAGAAINDLANITNITWLNTDTKQDIMKSLSADGTMSFYTYSEDPYNRSWKTTEVRSGVPNSGQTDIVDGTDTTTTVGSWGETLSSSTVDIASGLQLDSALYSGYDEFRRSYTVTHLDGTKESFSYDCCGLSTSTDRDGAVTSYTYDDLKRQIGASRLGISTTNLLDGAGRVLKTVRVGTDSSTIQSSLVSYDLNGELLNETNALGGVTTHAWTTNSAGETILTDTYPDGGTRVQTNYQDGTTFMIGGTAVSPVKYAYGADGDGPYTLAIKLTATGTNEWTKTSLNMLGKPYKTVYAGSGPPTAITYYDRFGRATNHVDADGVSMITFYNPRGRNMYAVRHGGSAGIDWALDRIYYSTNYVNAAHSTNVLSSQTSLTNSTGTNLVSLRETSTDGTKSWNTIYNGTTPLTTSSQTAYSLVSNKTVTVTAPDNSSKVSAYGYGRLLSMIRKDSGGSPMATNTYGYDSHGRNNTITDVRTGTTTNFFNNLDEVSGMATPIPAIGQSSQVTSNYFDTLGRLWKTTLADGTSTTNLFQTNGLTKLALGSRVYPTGTGYDAQGRMNTMTNWTSFAAPAGMRTNGWTYDAYRGWLIEKKYDDGHGPTYAYTPAGRLNTRTWARSITTTYGTNGFGEVGTVQYSDGVTAGITNGYDLRGRQTIISNGPTVTTLVHGDAGQLLSESYSGGPLNGISVTNGYDQYLRRTNLAVLNGGSLLTLTTNSYDAAGRLIFISDRTNSATYSYLANSLLVSNIDFKQSGTVRMTTIKTYDNLNRLTSISSKSNTLALASSGYQYNSANQRTSITNVDSSRWLFGYDTLGQVTSGKKYWSDNSIVAGEQLGYKFDDIGNRISTSAGGDQYGANLRWANYTVNDLNQYTSRTVPNAIDVIGDATNNATVTINALPTYRKGTYFRAQVPIDNSAAAVWQTITNVAVLNRSGSTDLVASNVGNIFLPQNAESFAYDGDGNLTNDGRWSYTWDAENRLLSLVSLTNAPATSKLRLLFTYDSKGRRTSKRVEIYTNSDWLVTVSNLFVYDGWNLIAELNGTNNALIRAYMWGTDLSGSMQGAGGVGGLLAVTLDTAANAGTYFCAFDGNGNVSALTKASDGTIAAQYQYGPFGEVLRATGPAYGSNPFRFSTKYQDDESDLVYYGNRHLNTSRGNWINRDPIGEKGGYNVYLFALNNAINYYDKIGFSANAAPDLYITTPSWVDNQCGTFALNVNWHLNGYSDNGGYIIQEVKASVREYNCSDILTHKEDYHYGEAWRVSPATKSGMIAYNAIEYGGLDSFKNKAVMRSRGIAIFKAKATFEEGLLLLGPDWISQNPNTAAGDLPSTTLFPLEMGSRSSASVARKLVYVWDCCCAKHKPVISSAPDIIQAEIDNIEFIMDAEEGIELADQWEESFAE